MRGRPGDVIGRQADFSSLGLGVSQVQSSERVRPPGAGGACGCLLQAEPGASGTASGQHGVTHPSEQFCAKGSFLPEASHLIVWINSPC